MRGWQLVAIGEPLELVEKPDPTPGPGEVVIEVKAAGLCHSDVDEITVDHGVPIGVGMYVGHEMAGVISAVGPDVATWSVGDRVAICPTGSPRVPGYFRDGGFATKHLAPVSDLVAIPDGVDWTLGAMMTDAGMTSYHALVKRGGAAAGMKIGIIGLGGLGQIAARVAVLLGAEVHVAEVKPDAWELGRRLGVEHFVTDAAEWRGGRFDLVVDYAGFGDTTNAAIRAVREDGTVVQVGLGVREAQISLGDLISKNVRLIASRGGTGQDIAELYEYVAAGDLAPEATVIGFDDIPEGLARLAANQVTGRLVALV